jgi:acetate kinase
MTETILVINAGSSSIKFQLFNVAPGDRLQRRMKGQIEGVGTRPRLLAKDIDGNILADETWSTSEVGGVPDALAKLVQFLRQQIGQRLPAAVGHRVVHGGPDYSAPRIVNGAVLRRLERLAPLAPLHQLNNLGPIRAIMDRQPHLLQVACFDTAFHRGHPEVADRFAIPEELYVEGVRRYGFHGLSYEYIAERLKEISPEAAKGRVVVAHLGSGASMCAIHNGRSVESTMGFTALDGLPMGTRPGQLDAGIVLYLMNQKRMTASEAQRFLYNDCGLKGLSGVSNDVRDLLQSPEPRAKLALDCFTYRIALSTGSLAAAMNGIDALVFTAGIGEHAPAIREMVLKRVAWLGLKIAPQANEKNRLRISDRRSRVACFVIPTDEELMIAKHTLRVLRENTGSNARRNTHERPIDVGAAQREESSRHWHRERPVDCVGMCQSLS